jgi:hypothetical protein
MEQTAMEEHVDWAAHLSAIEAEGISVQAYARRENLSAASLYYWRKRLKLQVAPSGDGSVPQWVAVQLSDQPVTGQRCTLWLAPGVRLELSALPSGAWLAQVAAAVSQQVR